MIRHIIAETDALTILPREVVQPEIEAGTIVALKCATPVERTRIGLIFREGGLMTPQAEVVVERIRKEFAERQASAVSDPQ